jgi:hypothetical protein
MKTFLPHLLHLRDTHIVQFVRMYGIATAWQFTLMLQALAYTSTGIQGYVQRTVGKLLHQTISTLCNPGGTLPACSTQSYPLRALHGKPATLLLCIDWAWASHLLQLFNMHSSSSIVRLQSVRVQPHNPVSVLEEIWSTICQTCMWSGQCRIAQRLWTIYSRNYMNFSKVYYI